MTTITLSEEDGPKVEQLAGRLFEAGLAALELINVELGNRLGLYEALAAAGPSTPARLSEAAGIAERYAREWLEQQVVAGILDVDDASAEPDARVFSLSRAHAHVLLDPDSEAYLAPFASAIPPLAGMVGALVDAFRTGSGLPYADYGFHDVAAAWSRPAFIHHLTQTWLPAMPSVVSKLESGAARLCEIGCGEGVAAIQIAIAFPGVTIDAFDLDDASIASARKLAADAGVGDRVSFEVRDGATVDSAANYDLVYCIEMLHDLADPVGVLTAMRGLRGPDGDVLVVDERAAEAFTPDADPIERMLYAFSTLHCLPVGMTAHDSAGTGAVMRPDTLRRYAAVAGFASVEILPVEHAALRLYRLIG